MDNFGFGLVFVMFAPLLLSPQYHFVAADTSLATRNFYLGLLFAAYPLTQLFGAPILGDYADRAGRKKGLYISIIGVTIGFFLSGVACLFTSLSFLIISRLISGFFAGNLSICMSAIADLSPTEKDRSHNFGIMMVIWGVSWNAAMLVGGYLSDPTKSRFFGPSVPFWLTTILTLLSLVAIARYYTETHKTEGKVRLDLIKGLHNIKYALKLKNVRPYFITIFIWTIGWGLSVQWFSTYSILTYNTSQEGISWGLLIQGLFWMFGGLLLNPFLLKKFKSLPITIIGNIFCSALLFLTMIPKQFYSFAAIYWISAMFASTAFSNNMNLASIHAPKNVQGKIMGISQSMMSLAWVITPLIGALIGGNNPRLFYPTAGGFIVITLFLLLIEYRKEKCNS